MDAIEKPASRGSDSSMQLSLQLHSRGAKNLTNE